jgi:hypothetical protein
MGSTLIAMRHSVRLTDKKLVTSYDALEEGGLWDKLFYSNQVHLVLGTLRATLDKQNGKRPDLAPKEGLSRFQVKGASSCT